MWTCPNCGREFRNKNQWHSCVNYSVEHHFEGNPGMRQLFDALVGKLEGFGPVRVDAVKTGINLGNKVHFAEVKVRKNWINVSFVLGRVIDHPKIAKSDVLTPTMVDHRVKVSSLDELDDTLLGWLREAYDLHNR